MNRPALILNVDDNPGALSVKTRILQAAGFGVMEATSGMDALALVRRHNVALVLLDVKLPDIGGIEVCRRIKGDPDTAAVLVLHISAALVGRADRIRGLEGGADNYLSAPIDSDELVANVNALLRMRQAEWALRDSEERFRELTDNIGDVFWMFSVPQGRLEYVSPAYAALWGHPVEALERAPVSWLDAVHVDDLRRVQALWESVPEAPHYDVEFRIVLADGAVRWVRDRLFPIRDGRAVVYRVARITSDVTRRREMEGLLYAADAHKNEFLATLAHELRNPLSPIRNAAALLGPHEDGDARRARAREVITRQVDHLTHLVDDLLDVARITEGKIVLRRDALRLGTVIAQAIESVAPLVAARGHALALVQPVHDVWVAGDAMRLRQSIARLLQNAAKFTPQAGHIWIEVATEGSRARIIVRDDGIGIAAADIGRIFGMFVQAGAPPGRAREGLGIGLALVARLVEMHGGALSASSPGPGQGSTFIVDLPALPAQLAMAAATHIPVDVTPAGRRVLMVDDNADAVEIMGMLLEQMGYEVATMTDAGRLVELALELKPDVIMLDIGLPGVDGNDLARMLKRHPQLGAIRLIAHTGHGADEDRNATRAAGFDAHLVKPARPAELEQALRGD